VIAFSALKLLEGFISCSPWVGWRSALGDVGSMLGSRRGLLTSFLLAARNGLVEGVLEGVAPDDLEGNSMFARFAAFALRTHVVLALCEPPYTVSNRVLNCPKTGGSAFC
jgi:hypothetical protein